MRLKTRPEDFIVREAYHFEATRRGVHRVYLMDKQKLSTLEAVARVAEAAKVPVQAISFCGLKDKQGRTEQIIAVKGRSVELQAPDLRLKYLGRTGAPLSAANLRANRFVVTVRDLSLDEAERVPASVREVRRTGIVNYFDSQRFGSRKHGQGWVVRDLLQGRSEQALRALIARPSRLDRSNDAKIKAFWARHWGEWKRRCKLPGAERYEPILRSLRRYPKDYLRAFGALETRRRTLLLFEYQSYLWNETARVFLEEAFPEAHLLTLRYQAGRQRFPRPGGRGGRRGPSFSALRAQTLPLLSPESPLDDPAVARAVERVLRRQKLGLEDLRLPRAARVYFKHEERDLVIRPARLSVVDPRPDELHPGRVKVTLAFTLPAGAYATLLVRRVMWFADRQVLTWGGPIPPPDPDFLPRELRKEVQARFSRAQGRRNRRPRPVKGIAVELAAREKPARGRPRGRRRRPTPETPTTSRQERPAPRSTRRRAPTPAGRGGR